MELDTVNKFIERHRKLSTKMGSDMILSHIIIIDSIMHKLQLFKLPFNMYFCLNC